MMRPRSSSRERNTSASVTVLQLPIDKLPKMLQTGSYVEVADFLNFL